MRRKALATLAILVLIGIAVFAFVEVAPPAMVLCGSMMDIEGGSETADGKWVNSYWVYLYTVRNAGDTIKFELKDLNEPHSTEIDARIKSAGSADVITIPYGSYWISLEVRKFYYGLRDSKTDGGSPESMIAFYKVTGWQTAVAPYDVTLNTYDNVGSLKSTVTELGVAGDPTLGWTTNNFTVGSGIMSAEIWDVGLISRTMTSPPSDLIIDYTPTGELRVFLWTNYESKLEWFHNNVPYFGAWSYQTLWDRALNGITPVYNVQNGVVERSKYKGLPTYVKTIPVSTPTDTELWNKMSNRNFSQISRPLDSMEWLDYGGVGAYAITFWTGTVNALVQLRVRSEVVDSWVWRPPYGIPQITSISDATAIGGDYATVRVDVKNIGMSMDTFTLKVRGTNFTYTVSPTQLNINKGTIGTFLVTLSTGIVTEQFRQSVEVEAVAQGSGRTAIAYFWLTLNPKPTNGNGGYGLIAGSVIDSRTKQGLANVSLTVGGKYGETKTGGSFLIEGVPAGSWALSVMATNYYPVQRQVSITKGITTNVGVIELTELGMKSWWEEYLLVIIAVVIAAIAIISGIAIARRKG